MPKVAIVVLHRQDFFASFCPGSCRKKRSTDSGRIINVLNRSSSKDAATCSASVNIGKGMANHVQLQMLGETLCNLTNFQKSISISRATFVGMTTRDVTITRWSFQICVHPLPGAVGFGGEILAIEFTLRGSLIVFYL